MRSCEQDSVLLCARECKVILTASQLLLLEGLRDQLLMLVSVQVTQLDGCACVCVCKLYGYVMHQFVFHMLSTTLFQRPVTAQENETY